MIALGIAQLLAADTRFTAVSIGGIFPLLLPDAATPPATTYQLISAVNEYTFDGSLGMATARIQLDAWAKDYESAAAVRTVIRQVLDGYRGTLPDGTQVSYAWLDSEQDLYEPQDFLIRASADWRVIYHPQ